MLAQIFTILVYKTVTVAAAVGVSEQLVFDPKDISAVN
jgi:hypothetical protein